MARKRSSATEQRLAMERVAVKLSRILPERHALIGGLAVGVYGYVRATKDVDFVVLADSQELREKLRNEGIDAQLRRGDAFEGDIPWVLFGEYEGVRFDILPPTVPIEWDRREWVKLGDDEIMVVDIGSLVRLKLRAGGSHDLFDVAHLLRKHPEEQQRALEIADFYRLRDRLERRLHDETLRSPDDTVVRRPARPRAGKPR